MLKQIVQGIETLNEWVGRTVSWLIVLMVFTTFAVAVLRYGFSLGWVWLQESYVWMHGIVFMVASGYTLRHDVRTDVRYLAIFVCSTSDSGPACQQTVRTVDDPLQT